MNPVESEQILEIYRADPGAFLYDILGVKLWRGQDEAIDSVVNNSETGIKTCHSWGKDWFSARMVLWFVYCYKPSLALTTAPTDRQVKGILWQEIAMAHAQAKVPLGGRIMKQELHASEDQRALGFTATDATRFQGWHCPNMFVILDEAAAIEQDIYVGVDSCLASGITKIRLEIGNPTDPTSEFAKSFKTPGIKKLSYSAYDTPNFTEFGITEDDIADGSWEDIIGGRDLPAPWLVTPEWVAQRYRRWGPNNPLYMSRVNADFPTEGEDTLIPLRHIEAAQERHLEPEGKPHLLSLDVARYGPDSCVIGHRQGPVVRIRQRWGKVDTMVTTGHAIRQVHKWRPSHIAVDVIGVGSGVADRLRERGAPVIDAAAGNQASDPDSYANQRAEWYWNLRTAFEDGEIDLDPQDEELAAQLADIKWKPDSKGRITIEKKEEIKKRIGRSPDDADAVAMLYMSSTKWLDNLVKAMQKI
jgi:hypothetical protein